MAGSRGVPVPCVLRFLQKVLARETGNSTPAGAGKESLKFQFKRLQENVQNCLEVRAEFFHSSRALQGDGKVRQTPDHVDCWQHS